MKKVPSRPKKTAARTANLYRLKITLKHVAPAIWRRLEVPADTKLPRLHRILQMAMGWYDAHLHAFRTGRTSFGVPDPDFPGGVENERSVRLGDIVAEGGKLIYEYDFGDGWEHEIKVEKVFAPEPGVRYPRCLAGKRACPPEDCGGPYGYRQLLDVLGNPQHPEYAEMREWVREDFDPEEFDLDDVNEGLRRVR